MNDSKSPAMLATGQGRTFCLAGELITIKVASAQTEGRYALIEVLSQPGGGTPPHVHRREAEIFTILEGRYAFDLPGKTIIAEAGSTVFAPANVPHCYRNIGDSVGRMLVGMTPGALDAFFMEAGDEVPKGTTTPLPVTQERIAKLGRTCTTFSIEMLAPDQKLGGPVA